MTIEPTTDAAVPDLPPKGSMSWDGDTLVVDPDEPVFKAVVRTALSPSTSNAMQDCAARWFVEKLKPQDENPFDPAPLGTAAHAVMEDLYDRPHDQRTPADAYKLLLTITDRHPNITVPADPLDLARWRDKVMLVMSGLWEIEDPAATMTGQREQKFDQVSVRGVPLMGFVDRVDPVVTDDGELGLRIVDYKGLALDTPIPTPAGWSTMGDLHVGDSVYGTSGEPVLVTVKSEVHHRPCYRITFSDGTSVVCDNVHLWTVQAAEHGTETLDADRLFERVCAGESLALPTATRPDGSVVEVTVASVEPVESVPTQCIQVAAQDSLYLCGQGMVPTHNTGKWSTAAKLKMYGDDYAEQMRTYALALQELTGVLPVQASLYYTAVGKSRDVPLGPRLLEKTANRLVDSWDKHNEYTSTGRWPTKPSGLCNFCPLATVCPAAAARDKPVEPRNDSYLFGEAVLEPLGAPPTEDPEDIHDFPPPLDPPDEAGLLVPDEPDAHEQAARHTSTEPVNDHEESTQMAANKGPWANTEDKAWEETAQGDIHAASYAATAAFGLAGMALEQLHEAGQPINGNTVPAMALTLSSLVLEVQHDLSGSANFQRALNTRLRGALHSALATLPIPFGESGEVWDQWSTDVKRRMKSIALTAHKVWDTGVVDRPYAALVEATTPRPTKQNSEVSAS